jgi:hypothetical protein
LTEDLLEKYAGKGVLVDTNILLLLFVGSFDRTKISVFKRTSRFTPEDYDKLVVFLEFFTRPRPTF